MAIPPPVTLRALLHVGVSPAAWHALTSGLLIGSSLWGSFISGVIAFKTLPRQQFGNLQARTFPVYFRMVTGLSAFLLIDWFVLHPWLLQDGARLLLHPRLAASFNAWLLAGLLALNAVNQFLIGPWTTNLMWQRHKMERAEGKSYSDASASEPLKQLSKKFGTAHGVSSIVNMAFFLGSCLHVAWIGAYGF